MSDLASGAVASSPDPVHAVTAAIRDVLPRRVAVAAAIPSDRIAELHPREAHCVQHVAAVRRDEFSTGRVLARSLLAQLDAEPEPLLPGDDRAPIWPKGIVGSISHTRSLCAVIAARTPAVRSLGIDLECDEPLNRDLWPQIFTPAELARLADFDDADGGTLAKVGFSAKECFYKAQYPLTRRFLDFQEVELQLDVPSRRFTARPMVELELPEQSVAGCWRFAAGHLITLVALDGSEEPPW